MDTGVAMRRVVSMGTRMPRRRIMPRERIMLRRLAMPAATGTNTSPITTTTTIASPSAAAREQRGQRQQDPSAHQERHPSAGLVQNEPEHQRPSGLTKEEMERV